MRKIVSRHGQWKRLHMAPFSPGYFRAIKGEVNDWKCVFLLCKMPCRAVKVPLFHSSGEQEAAGMCSVHTEGSKKYFLYSYRESSEAASSHRHEGPSKHTKDQFTWLVISKMVCPSLKSNMHFCAAWNNATKAKLHTCHDLYLRCSDGWYCFQFVSLCVCVMS